MKFIMIMVTKMRTRTIIGLLVLIFCLFGVLIYPIPLLRIYNSQWGLPCQIIQVNSTIVDVSKVDDGYNIVVDADLTYIGTAHDRKTVDNKDEIDIRVELSASKAVPDAAWTRSGYVGTVSKLTISTINNQPVHWTGNVTVPHQGEYDVGITVLYDRPNRIIGTSENVYGWAYHHISI